jgi:hypothetical protein
VYAVGNTGHILGQTGTQTEILLNLLRFTQLVAVAVAIVEYLRVRIFQLYTAVVTFRRGLTCFVLPPVSTLLTSIADVTVGSLTWSCASVVGAELLSVLAVAL